ncbi:winged helix-turn-helix domain-containing protein [Chryseobacterium sp.]|uniref:ArsR/SmtB family transcription factor n=1 Tax=Chryseobacterium sp. TaxID=1871047 RepID=UPI0025BCB94B|nr:winged helix-turn-helix domain-containing protein [Chryseobacterium sp.]MBV8327215.1 winged helix-turn-helix transcriptional regulator [Chryseobacterium sp.]
MEIQIKKIAALIGEPVRALVLWTLLDKRAYTAIELANVAETSPQNMSMHLAKLLEANLLHADKQGRHRYYRLSGPEVAFAVEAISTLIPDNKRISMTEHNTDITYCRTCYDHLAGKIGVLLTENLVNKNFLQLKDNSHYMISPEGEIFFNSIGIDLENLKQRKRILAKTCLDWSERKYHVSGALGQALLNKMLNEDLMRRKKNSRAVIITHKGEKLLNDVFDLKL